MATHESLISADPHCCYGLTDMIRPRGLHLSTIFRLLNGRKSPIDAPRHLFLCIADHYEPMNGGVSPSIETERVSRWVDGYPKAFAAFADCRGRPPQHTFFYPAESYLGDDLSVRHVERIAELCRAGFGDVEAHLHHDNDTSDNLTTTLTAFTTRLHDRHGLFKKDEEGRIRYGFIHGNWALDNSRPDGKWCGVNDEITVLRETGCYADFTFPSAPSVTQPRTVNSIYYAFDDPHRSKSHDTGVLARVGQARPPEGLLMIQGPMQLDWRRRKFGVAPGLENSDLHGSAPPTENRMRLWLQASVSVVGRPDWVFVKLHTHGAVDRNADMFLGERMQSFHRLLASKHAADRDFRYHYVTAREMADLVHQAERGLTEPEF